MGGIGNLFQVQGFVQRHAAGVDIEHLQPAVLVGNADLDLSIEAAASADGRVQGIGPVGGRYYYHLAPGRESVHKRQELSHDAPFQVAGDLFAFRSDGVDLIDEYDGGGRFCRLFEDLAQPLLALAIELGDNLRAGDGDEVGIGLAGYCPRYERLSCSRRSVQQYSAGRVDA